MFAANCYHSMENVRHCGKTESASVLVLAPAQEKNQGKNYVYETGPDFRSCFLIQTVTQIEQQKMKLRSQKLAKCTRISHVVTCLEKVDLYVRLATLEVSAYVHNHLGEQG